jgi:pimeloyl-ACP methyl ester carboxylesterase
MLEANARIIAADRPGYGLSGFERGRRMLDWPVDVSALVDALQFDRFAVLGISGGGPYAAACAFKIPGRLAAAGVVSGMGPPAAPGMKDGAS